MMAKLKRRAFLKMAALAVVAPSLFKSKGLTPGLTNPVDIFMDLTGCPDSPFLQEMREYLDMPMKRRVTGIPLSCFTAAEDIHPMDMLEIREDGKAYKADFNSDNFKLFFFGPAKEFVSKDDQIEL